MLLTRLGSLAVFARLATPAFALDNGVGVLPALGWNSWNTFATDISEEIIITAAKEMVNSGLAALGYKYILVDDGATSHERTPEGAIQANTTKFPSGVKNLTDSIHSINLKVGMYSDAGEFTCGSYPGSLGHEVSDAQTWAAWGVDYLKYDNCFNQGQSGNANISYERYERMSRALNATDRPILYSLCTWGQDNVWDWASTIANSYRISGDIYPYFDRFDARCPCDTYDCLLPGYHCSVTNIVDKGAPLGQKVRAGSYGDWDMLEVGVGGLMTFAEQVAHFSLWSMAKSPLILGNDLGNMSTETLSIISNKVMISINQDSLSSPAHRVFKKEVAAEEDSSLATWQLQPTTAGSLQLWSGRLEDGFVVALFNTSPRNLTYDLELSEALDIFDYGPEAQTLLYNVYDVWAPAADPTAPKNASRAEAASRLCGADAGVVSGSIPAVVVEAHGIRVFKLTAAMEGVRRGRWR
uniref:Alpha-galactosidase n=1 Tax=Glaciozyma antarctica TaxID=105987 RepID=A0A223AMX6_9BASI|nr:Gal48 [Glaciozyma antarctica]